MSLISFLLLLLIAGICGSLGQVIAGSSRGGWVVSIVIGFIGAFLGMWIGRQLHLQEPLTVRLDGQSYPILWSIIGSIVLVAVLSLFNRQHRGNSWFRS